MAEILKMRLHHHSSALNLLAFPPIKSSVFFSGVLGILGLVYGDPGDHHFVKTWSYAFPDR